MPSERKYKISSHCDDTYTLFFRPTEKSLEVEGNWQDLKVEENEILIVAPNMEHRVRNTTRRERYAIAMARPSFPI